MKNLYYNWIMLQDKILKNQKVIDEQKLFKHFTY